MERVAGIEPASSAWKAEVLPLNYTRVAISPGSSAFQAVSTVIHCLKMVVGAGFEPAKLSRQIYSLIPLAAREPHQSGAYYQYEAGVCQQLFCLFIINLWIIRQRVGDDSSPFATEHLYLLCLRL